MNQSLFSALWLEKMAISITIGLIVMVAALNIIASLVLLVMEKSRDIAILKTMGTLGGEHPADLHAAGAGHRPDRHARSAPSAAALSIYVARPLQADPAFRSTSTRSRYVPFRLEPLDFVIVVASAIRSASGVEQDEARTTEKLSVPGLKMKPTDNIDGVQWGKLLLNLNNALNALADLPLRRQLAQRPWRRLFADQVAEGLAAIRAEGIKPVSPTPIPMGLLPPLLRLPDPIFEALLGRTMKIDPEARSSMWEDLQRGRRTEVDYLQGVITEIAERRGLDAPLSRRIVELIRQAETNGKGSPGLTPEQIRDTN